MSSGYSYILVGIPTPMPPRPGIRAGPEPPMGNPPRAECVQQAPADEGPERAGTGETEVWIGGGEAVIEIEKEGVGVMRQISGTLARTGAWTLVVAAGLSATGCESPPHGNTGGRVPIGTTTSGEAGSGLMRSDDLVEAGDRIATALAADISKVIERDFAGAKVTVTFGDINNKTSKMTTTDFEFVRDRIKTRVLNSDLAREGLRIVENRARREQLREREQTSGGYMDGGPRKQPKIDEQTFVFLNGDMYSVDRPGTRLYYLKFELMRASDGETVFSRDYEVKYQQIGS